MPFPVIVARVIADAFPLILVSSHVIPVIPFQGRRRRRRRALSWLRRYIAPLGQNRRTTRGQWPIYRVVGSNDDPLICPFTGNNPLSFPFRVSCCRSAEHDYYVYIDTSSCVRVCVCVSWPSHFGPVLLTSTSLKPIHSLPEDPGSFIQTHNLPRLKLLKNRDPEPLRKAP